MNSKQKGNRGERELAKKLKEYGYDCRRGQDGRFESIPNTYITTGELVECYNSRKELLFFSDIELFGLIASHNWCKSANGYAATKIADKIISAHRYILGAKHGQIIDHINRNKKDNRRCNLRFCSKSQNAYNSKVPSCNKSGHKGVWFRKDTNKWVSEIKINYKKISLGCYENIEDAKVAREKSEIQYGGSHAN